MSRPPRSGDAVRFEDVHMIFQSGLKAPVWALRGLTWGVPAGAVMGLLGPNGAGKTTAISCMLGLLDPQVGHVEVWGERVSSLRSHRREPVGVLLEDTRLPPFLSVRSALEVVCGVRGVAASDVEISRVVEIAGIGDLLSRTVAALSKGQARRVGLASALVADPRLLVLDEPSAGLDAEARVEFDELVRTLRDGRRTMVIASHMLGDVEATCTHVAVVRDGRVVLAGRSEELLAEARRGQGSDVHVDAGDAAALDRLGIAHEPSRYAGLALVRSTLLDADLLAKLSTERIVPRRIEPRVSMLSLYIDVARRQEP